VVIPVTTTSIYLYGLTGAASSWIVYHLFLYAYMIPRICRECLGFSVRSWYSHVMRPFALSALTYGSVWILVVVPHAYSTPALIAAYVVATAVFLAVALVIIGPDLRETIWRLPQRLTLRHPSGVS
jgi:hypothetical protein